MNKELLIDHLEKMIDYLNKNYELNNENKKDIETIYARGKSIVYNNILQNIKDGMYD